MLSCRSCRLSCIGDSALSTHASPPNRACFLVLPSLRDDHAMEPAGLRSLDFELLVLKSIAGVDRVYEFPKGRFDSSRLNNNYIE